jgi:hypothetical protein
MMKLNQLTRMAKDVIDRRGGVDAIKQDLQEARQAASGHDNLMDKARAAAGAFKQPGDDGGAGGEAASRTPGGPPSSETPADSVTPRPSDTPARPHG